MNNNLMTAVSLMVLNFRPEMREKLLVLDSLRVQTALLQKYIACQRQTDEKAETYRAGER